MKNILFSLFLLTVSIPVAGATQFKADVIPQGTMLAGGFVTFSWSKESIDDQQDTKVTEQILGFSPMAGIFVYPNLALMVSVNLSREEAESRLQSTSTIEKTDMYGAMGGIRYYIPTGKIYLYAGLMGGMYKKEAQTKLDDIVDVESTLKTKGYQFNLHGGILYMLTKNIGLELGVQFIYTKGEVDGETPTEQNQDLTDYSFALGYFGIQALF
ncbi:hypothetical protein KKF84_02260 [Myxococcota bacterium]|nr:hypothetical protein [Myxococcota bacterium]MBU1534111.1 hypothetical protein [Myxococcota bacterium]